MIKHLLTLYWDGTPILESLNDCWEGACNFASLYEVSSSILRENLSTH